MCVYVCVRVCTCVCVCVLCVSELHTCVHIRTANCIVVFSNVIPIHCMMMAIEDLFQISYPGSDNFACIPVKMMASVLYVSISLLDTSHKL